MPEKHLSPGPPSGILLAAESGVGLPSAPPHRPRPRIAGPGSGRDGPAPPAFVIAVKLITMEGDRRHDDHLPMTASPPGRMVGEQ
jgi:hypothetical protein